MMGKLESLRNLSSKLDPCLVLIGGSGIDGNDIDLIIVTKDVDTFKLAEFKKEATELMGKKVSVCPMSKLMYQKKIWSGKVARMIYKKPMTLRNTLGIDYQGISEEELVKITKQNATEQINHYLKIAVRNPEKKEKMFQLMTQLAIILAQ